MIEYNNKKPLRCFFAFEGYNAQGLALRRLSEHFPDFAFTCVGRSEIDKYAIQACEALFPEEAGKNYGDVTKIDWSAVPDFDLITWSSPCTSISNAGKREGLVEGSGTESSLLWELRKVLDCKKPRYIILENVKAFVGKKNIKEVGRFFDMLRDYGYSVHWSVMNAKEYGVPQNRERVFVVAILGDETYSFPKPFELKQRLKDILEEEVDEKYYLSDRMIEGFKRHNLNHENKGTGFTWQPKTGEEIANCLRANGALASTDNTILVSQPITCAMRGRNPDNPSDRTAGINTEQRIEMGGDVANCITTVQKDSLVVEPVLVGGVGKQNFGKQ